MASATVFFFICANRMLMANALCVGGSSCLLVLPSSLLSRSLSLLGGLARRKMGIEGFGSTALLRRCFGAGRGNSFLYVSWLNRLPSVRTIFDIVLWCMLLARDGPKSQSLFGSRHVVGNFANDGNYFERNLQRQEKADCAWSNTVVASFPLT